MLAPALAPARHLPVTLRDDAWLVDHVEAVWDQFFADVPQVNEVEIGWLRPWKTRLGLITLRHPSDITFIGLNSLLRHPDVPEVLLTVTVAHELVHYSHGFGSPLPRRYRHPHLGGVVERDLEQRGFGAMVLEYDRWIEAHWWDLYAAEVGRFRAITRHRPAFSRQGTPIRRGEPAPPVLRLAGER